MSFPKPPAGAEDANLSDQDLPSTFPQCPAVPCQGHAPPRASREGDVALGREGAMPTCAREVNRDAVGDRENQGGREASYSPAGICREKPEAGGAFSQAHRKPGGRGRLTTARLCALSAFCLDNGEHSPTSLQSFQPAARSHKPLSERTDTF